ncbi:hypothetical protein [Deinococcus maricopensis]|uniref:Uncharacterized protein n=1 Tax=Deinococcus maricopensis (strain DSM 21211 / LMG 22137 / NRRL B-23946 / LB-34) TaxID=709986 RepID=E8UB57_DEIML|nr:hypothetical protein [Deinococcus maricopensis]ADV68296.1 hypothetical protein Deima_2663 [Deinococcus maricopensis DSM 21211]
MTDADGPRASFRLGGCLTALLGVALVCGAGYVLGASLFLMGFNDNGDPDGAHLGQTIMTAGVVGGVIGLVLIVVGLGLSVRWTVPPLPATPDEPASASDDPASHA